MTPSRRELLAGLAASAALLGPLGGAAFASQGAGTLAVLYFHNQGNPELEPLKVGLTQMLITDLQQATAGGLPVKVVERTQLQALLDELELGHSGVVDPDTAAKVGRLLGVERLVLGSYFALVGTLRIDARVVRVETGEIEFATGVNGTAPEFLRLERELGEALIASLKQQSSGGGGASGGGGTSGGGGASGGGAQGERAGAGSGAAGTGEAFVSGRPGGGSSAEIAAPDPQALDAAVAFGQGLIHLDKKDLARAREAFETAVAADPALEAARTQLAAMEL